MWCLEAVSPYQGAHSEINAVNQGSTVRTRRPGRFLDRLLLPLKPCKEVGSLIFGRTAGSFRGRSGWMR
jgi:hypothetical protein